MAAAPRLPASARPWPWRRPRRAQRGTSAVEFALVAPLLFAMVFVAIEVIVILFADASLEATASRITRIGKIGVPEGQTCESAVRQELDRSLAHWATGPGSLRLDIQRYTPGQDTRFGDVDDSSYEPVCDAGERGDVVMYRLGLDRPGLTGFLSWLGIRVMRLERTVMIQNEP